MPTFHLLFGFPQRAKKDIDSLQFVLYVSLVCLCPDLFAMCLWLDEVAGLLGVMGWLSWSCQASDSRFDDPRFKPHEEEHMKNL